MDSRQTNSFRETGELKLKIPALPRPRLDELQKEFNVIRSDGITLVPHDFIKSIVSDNSPTEPVTIMLGTILRQGENDIDGAEYEYRLRSINGQLGYQHGLWLTKAQYKNRELGDLAGKVCIHLPGLRVMLYGADDEYYPCLELSYGSWVISWHSIRYGFCLTDRVACSSG